MFLIPFACPSKVLLFLPPAASHTQAVPSWDAVTMCLPSRLRATLVTISVCPWNVLGFLLPAISHRVAVLSHDPETTSLPLPLRARLVTFGKRPSKVLILS